MTPVFFNELTLDSSGAQNVRLLRSFTKVWANFCSLSGGDGKRIFTDEKTISKLVEATYGGEVASNVELIHFMTTVLNTPYRTTEKTWKEEVRDRFYGAEFTINISPTRKNVECSTLGWAYLNRSITLGFESANIWRTLVHRITESTLEGGEYPRDVLCVTNKEHLEKPELQGWLLAQRDFVEVPLPPASKLAPNEKKIDYRDDHGREILDAFAKRLVFNHYVDAVINSLPWHPECNHFILGVREDGIVNICLHWHDKGYGLAVQTTARGKLQTQKVAELLEKQFDQRS